MLLTELPSEILTLIPECLYSIYDLYQLMQTCRIFYTICKDQNIRLPPILPRPDGQYLMAPYPRMLLVGTVRQVADWAIEHPTHQLRLLQQLRCGYDGLTSLTQEIARVTLQDMRNLYDLKYDLINPITDIIDYACGPNQGVDKEAAREEGRDVTPPPWTYCYEPNQAVLNYLIYCELFHHLVDGDKFCRVSYSMDPGWLENSIRLTFIARCMPDGNNSRSAKEEGRFDELEMLEFYRSGPMKRLLTVAKHFYQYGELTTDNALLQEEDESGSDDWSDGENKGEVPLRCSLFETLIQHMGADTLRLMLPHAERDDGKLKERVARLRRVATSVPFTDLVGWFEDTEAGDLERMRTERWPGWQGLPKDIRDSFWGLPDSHDPEEEAKRWDDELQILINEYDDAVQKQFDNPLGQFL